MVIATANPNSNDVKERPSTPVTVSTCSVGEQRRGTEDRPSGRQVFISYSHKDEVWRERLVEHLQILKHQCTLDLWHDRMIDMGDHWRDKINDALNQSQAAILLLSASFMSSDFIMNEEIPCLRERTDRNDGFRLFPILVRPCAWEAVSWLDERQIRPLGGKALSGDTDYEVEVKLADMTMEIAKVLSLPCIYAYK